MLDAGGLVGAIDEEAILYSSISLDGEERLNNQEQHCVYGVKLEHVPDMRTGTGQL